MLKVETLSINAVKPYENNPRFNEQAVEAVAKSIQDFGFRNPIIVDAEHVIICGHTRYKAAKVLKLNKVPCIVAADLSEEQVKAFRLADNKVGELAQWEFDRLYAELSSLPEEMFTGFAFNEIAKKAEESLAALDEPKPESVDEDAPKRFKVTLKGEDIHAMEEAVRELKSIQGVEVNDNW